MSLLSYMEARTQGLFISKTALVLRVDRTIPLQHDDMNCKSSGSLKLCRLAPGEAFFKVNLYFHETG